MTRYLFVLLLFLAACGQSGPLYLPGDPSQIREAPAADSPRSEDEEDETAGGG